MVTLRLSVWGLAALSIFSGAYARPHHIHENGIAARDVALHKHVARDPRRKQAPVSGGKSKGWGPGMVYSPYADGGDCKSEDTMAKEINLVASKGEYGWLRIYGVDCNQVPVVVSCAAKNKMRVLLGIYDLSDEGKVADATKAIIAGVKDANKKSDKKEDDWSSIVGVSVGNEWLFNHPNDSAAKCKGLADSTRKTLRDAGFQGPVTNTDVWTIHLKNKELCGDDEIVTVNMHPFFDTSVTAQESGAFIKRHTEEIQKFCGKPVVVAETGWPTKGQPQKNAIPSPENQKTFLSEVKKNYKNYCVLSAFNEGWKKDGEYGVEKYWGVYSS
ncbi:Cell surface mannoprotein MP65 [Drechslerella dactyloides]|uniref:Cell surface mannoprotein MP65 n=1 Tax=Drechslerella dactyloides TaxID=74499 RepID=A0AAD6NIR5_DREDA|nr:Cell surface mannoprotein MP65 [Drechslerella dactyloides]